MVDIFEIISDPAVVQPIKNETNKLFKLCESSMSYADRAWLGDDKSVCECRHTDKTSANVSITIFSGWTIYS
jgi:hypothetical protein